MHRISPQFIDQERAEKMEKAMADHLLKPHQRDTVRIKGQVVTVMPVASAFIHDVIAPMPRRTQVQSPLRDDFGLTLTEEHEIPRISLFKVFWRFTKWIGVYATYTAGNLWDVLHRRDSEDRRAVRLRQAFERAGGTLIKIGQQLSIRMDLLPLRFCEELAEMLDNVPPFPTEQAIAIIERTTGKKLSDIFSAFDPTPIGSASIACVYQAVLRETGEKVAVKVRRPGIRDVFEQDFRVLNLLTLLGEWLTVIRPGNLANLRFEFRRTMSSELDLRREGRLQEMFRRRAKKWGEGFFTAPKVYKEFTNEEVLVQEFVSGIWLSEILAGIERGDEGALVRMKELNVKPRLLASRLSYVLNWGLFDNQSFHADPHPANIVVRANNQLVFIDFGACGYFNRPRQRMYDMMYAAYLREDIWTLSRLSLIASEPLPPVDITRIAKELELAYQHHFLMLKSKQSKWYERTSANMWLSSLAIIGKYDIPAPLDVLMYARATLLYDTLAARLNPKLDFYTEYQKFGRDARKKARKRVRKSLQQRLEHGLSGGDFASVERMATTLNGLMFRAQRLFAAPYDFAMVSYVVEKWVFVLLTLIRIVLFAAGLAAFATLAVTGIHSLTGDPLAFGQAFQQVVRSNIYLVAVALFILIHVRLLMFRFEDRSKEG